MLVVSHFMCDKIPLLPFEFGSDKILISAIDNIIFISAPLEVGRIVQLSICALARNGKHLGMSHHDGTYLLWNC
jgi:hypothetical protein